jgi:hypothetical protein
MSSNLKTFKPNSSKNDITIALSMKMLGIAIEFINYFELFKIRKLIKKF